MGLENLREERGISAREVARRIGEPPATVARWFSGEAEPRISEAAKLADLFRVSLDVLAGTRLAVESVITPDELEVIRHIRHFGWSRFESVARLDTGTSNPSGSTPDGGSVVGAKGGQVSHPETPVEPGPLSRRG